jgi:DNA adenine methylase
LNLDKCPFPWFGGKSKAAPLVWSLLGDVHHYVEPFAGSCAVLLNRPHPINRHYHSETVNDADGLLVNAWRAIQLSPELTADHASWPTSEADLMARHLALLAWRKDRELEHLMADPDWHCPKMAGWWINGLCQWIGSGWCEGNQPWVVGEDGRVCKRPKQGGVWRQLPHLGDAGRGVNRPAMRDGTPGQCRNGESIWHPAAPDLTSTCLVEWFQHLAQRLRWVRIVNGDWRRVCTGGAVNSLSVRQKKDGFAGIFLDPPYADTAGRADLYAVDSMTVAHDVREWALASGDNLKWRIVLACFDGEHDADAFQRAGWTAREWFKAGHLQGGMANLKKNGTHQQHRERMWCSPACLAVEAAAKPAKVVKASVPIDLPGQGMLFP